jgi:hypothetical protein
LHRHPQKQWQFFDVVRITTKEDAAKMTRDNDFFNDIEKKTNVSKQQLFELADSAKHANFSDERAVRRLIAQVSQVAGVPVSKEKEDRLVKAIVNNQIPMDFSTLAKMFNQSK